MCWRKHRRESNVLRHAKENMEMTETAFFNPMKKITNTKGNKSKRSFNKPEGTMYLEAFKFIAKCGYATKHEVFVHVFEPLIRKNMKLAGISDF